MGLSIYERLVVGAIMAHLASGKHTTPDMLAVLRVSARLLSATLPS